MWTIFNNKPIIQLPNLKKNKFFYSSFVFVVQITEYNRHIN